MSEWPKPDPPVGLDISHRIIDETLVVEVAGEVDLNTAPEFHAAITAAIEKSAGGPCILDLTEVTYIGSAGLTALLDTTRHAEARREPLRIVVDANRPVIRPIEITGLDDVLRLYHSVDEALKAGKQP